MIEQALQTKNFTPDVFTLNKLLRAKEK